MVGTTHYPNGSPRFVKLHSNYVMTESPPPDSETSVDLSATHSGRVPGCAESKRTWQLSRRQITQNVVNMGRGERIESRRVNPLPGCDLIQHVCAFQFLIRTGSTKNNRPAGVQLQCPSRESISAPSYFDIATPVGQRRDDRRAARMGRQQSKRVILSFGLGRSLKRFRPTICQGLHIEFSLQQALKIRHNES